MHAERFIPICSAVGARVYAPDNSSISFFNSPFPSHRESKAVDIYPPEVNFGDEVASPVNGVVMAVKKYLSPNPFPSRDSLYEHLILIECADNPQVLAKIIHVRPSVSVGYSIRIGEKIGVLIRSGYYPFWVDPHLHVELRDQKDRIRARGAYLLEISNAKPEKKRFLELTPAGELIGTVTHVEPRYVIVRLAAESFGNIGSFFGLKAMVGSNIGILDGGIPFIDYGGVVVNQKAMVGQHVFLAGTRIGKVTETLKGIARFKADSFRVIIDNCEYMGVSLKLNLQNGREIKLVPSKMGRVNLDVGDEISIERVLK